jgi:hypothetical protein
MRSTIRRQLSEALRRAGAVTKERLSKTPRSGHEAGRRSARNPMCEAYIPQGASHPRAERELLGRYKLINPEGRVAYATTSDRRLVSVDGNMGQVSG